MDLMFLFSEKSRVRKTQQSQPLIPFPYCWVIPPYTDSKSLPPLITEEADGLQPCSLIYDPLQLGAKCGRDGCYLDGGSWYSALCMIWCSMCKVPEAVFPAQLRETSRTQFVVRRPLEGIAGTFWEPLGFRFSGSPQRSRKLIFNNFTKWVWHHWPRATFDYQKQWGARTGLCWFLRALRASVYPSSSLRLVTH